MREESERKWTENQRRWEVNWHELQVMRKESEPRWAQNQRKWEEKSRRDPQTDYCYRKSGSKR